MSTTKAKARAEKDKGNAAFKAGDFTTAVGHYSAAIVADSSDPTFPLNRAAAYLKLGKNQDAERDCSTVLKLDARNVKALFRRGQARVALQKLREAQDDFQKALVLDPTNHSAKAELKKVEETLKIQSKSRPRQPIDISATTPPIASTSAVPSASSAQPKPKRRRVPIEIIEPSPLIPPALSTSKPGPGATSSSTDLLTPISSRQLSSADSAQRASAAPPPRPAPKTFQEAREARTGTRAGVGGGIFRPSGKHTIFGEKKGEPPTAPASPVSNVPMSQAVPDTHPTNPAAAPPSASASTASPTPAVAVTKSNGAEAPIKPPMTLLNLTKQWDRWKSSSERWALINKIPPSALPSLFQSSLEPSLLAELLHVFRDALSSSVDPSTAVRVREYMLGLARVPRFSTVVLFMNKEERALVKEVWSLAGGADGAEGMRAWKMS